MELQHSLNLINQILKQTVGLQYFCWEVSILNVKEKHQPISQVFGDTTILRWTSDLMYASRRNLDI